MGYYVKLTNSTLRIPAENVDTVFKAWVAMNDPKYDKHKSGGSYQGGKKTQSWYSWMDAEYDKTCKNAKEILEMLGFDVSETENGDISIDHYDSKTGQEDLFLAVVAHLLDGECTWVGEDGDCWSEKYPSSSQMVLQISN